MGDGGTELKYLSVKNSLGVISPDKPIESIEITREPFCYPTDPMHEVRTALTVYTDKRLDSDFFYALFKWAQEMKLLDGYGSAAPTKAIFNGPATIAFWSDGTKTVAKCKDGDEFDPMFGLMACAMRKTGKNRVRIDSWEEVVTSLADSIATADECRVLADMLNATADLMDCEGVMDELAEHDARKNDEVDTSVDYKPLFSATDGSGSVQFVSRDKFGSVSEKLIEEVDRYLDESDESIVDEILAFLHNLANKEEL